MVVGAGELAGRLVDGAVVVGRLAGRLVVEEPLAAKGVAAELVKTGLTAGTTVAAGSMVPGVPAGGM